MDRQEASAKIKFPGEPGGYMVQYVGFDKQGNRGTPISRTVTITDSVESSGASASASAMVYVAVAIGLAVAAVVAVFCWWQSQTTADGPPLHEMEPTTYNQVFDAGPVYAGSDEAVEYGAPGDVGLVTGALEEVTYDTINYDAMTSMSQPVANEDTYEDMSETAPAPQRNAVQVRNLRSFKLCFPCTGSFPQGVASMLLSRGGFWAPAWAQRESTEEEEKTLDPPTQPLVWLCSAWVLVLLRYLEPSALQQRTSVPKAVSRDLPHDFGRNLSVPFRVACLESLLLDDSHAPTKWSMAGDL